MRDLAPARGASIGSLPTVGKEGACRFQYDDITDDLHCSSDEHHGTSGYVGSRFTLRVCACVCHVCRAWLLENQVVQAITAFFPSA